MKENILIHSQEFTKGFKGCWNEHFNRILINTIIFYHIYLILVLYILLLVLLLLFILTLLLSFFILKTEIVRLNVIFISI